MLKRSLGAFALVTLAATALADQGSLRFGFNRLDNSAAASASAQTGFILGYGMNLRTPSTTPGNGSWEVGWMRNGGGDRADTFYAMLRWSVPVSPSFYAGAGAGVAYHSIDVPGLSTNKTAFATTGFLGIKVSDTADFELGYFMGGSVSGFKTDRWTASMRFRF